MLTTTSYPQVVRSSTHMEVDLPTLEAFQRNVVSDLQNIAGQMTTMRASISELSRANDVLIESLKWVGHHYPDVMEALASTVNVTVALDKSNDYGEVHAQAESV